MPKTPTSADSSVTSCDKNVVSPSYRLDVETSTESPIISQPASSIDFDETDPGLKISQIDISYESPKNDKVSFQTPFKNIFF